MQKNPVGWWEIGTKDADGLRDFFEKAFEWDIKKDDKMGYHEVPAGEGGGGFHGGGFLTITEEMGVPPYVTFYITVDDVDAMAEKVKGLGATIVKDCFDIEGVGRICIFQEPTGTMLGLFGKPTA